MAPVVGEPRRYSARLRQGLADTAAFLGGYAADHILRDGPGKLHARRLVMAVTGNANADGTGRAWQSLADVLPLLAEASPDTFLDAVDTDLRRDEPLLRSLFLDSQHVTFGTSSLHFSLVWALETLAWSGDHMSRAAHALARLAELDPDRDHLLSAFEAVVPATLGDGGSVEVWRALADLAAQHRQFTDAPWAMPADAVHRIEAAAAHFAPTSLIDLHTDLFGHRPRLPGIDPREHTVYDAALQAARRHAAGAILDSGGVPDLLRLGAAVVLPAAVGWAAAEIRGDELADELLPLLGTGGSDSEVARGYAGARIEADDLAWAARQLQRWRDGESVAQQAGLLLAVPRPNEALVAMVDRLPANVRAYFWERMSPLRSSPEARPLVVHHLIEHGRPWTALSVLVMMLPVNRTTGPAPDAHLVEFALLRAAATPSGDSQSAASLSWEVGELLDYLERSRSDLQTRARLEFLLTGILKHTRPARALEEALRADPALFAEIISYVYRSEDELATKTCRRRGKRSRKSGLPCSARGTHLPASAPTGP